MTRRVERDVDRAGLEQVDVLRAVLGRHVHDELAEWTAAQARWSQRLTGPAEVGLVRVGGDPLLPAGSRWPQWRGRWLSLVAVIDVAALTRDTVDLDLPSVERVNVFYDLANPLGEGYRWVPGHYVVPVGADAVLTSPPDRSLLRLEPVTYAVRPVLTIPRCDEPVIARRCGLTAADDPWRDPRLKDLWSAVFEWEELCDAAGGCDEGQIGGWPNLYQNPILDDCQYFTHTAETGVRVVAPNDPRPTWRQLAQFGWSTVLDPILGDTRLHVCYNAASTSPLTETAVRWQGT